jgi:Ca2+/Na+ antiporter
METITLRSRIGRLERASYLLFGVVFVYAVFHAAMRTRVLETLALLLLGLVIAFVWNSGRNRSQIRINGAGLILEAFHAATLRIPWSEIEAFGIAELVSLSNGVRQNTGEQFIGIRLANMSALKDTKQCSANRLVSDYDVLVSARYGMPLNEFEAFLNAARKQAASGPVGPN